MELTHLSRSDCRSLLDFETHNKNYFEQYVPPRPSAYFKFDSLLEIIDNLLLEQHIGTCKMHVAYKDEKIIARMNLTNITDSTADLGYRICQTAVGKGYATKLVNQILELAQSDYGLTQINAHTTTNNPASIKVLEKSGFKHLHTKETSLTLNGKAIIFTYYNIKL